MTPLCRMLCTVDCPTLKRVARPSCVVPCASQYSTIASLFSAETADLWCISAFSQRLCVSLYNASNNARFTRKSFDVSFIKISTGIFPFELQVLRNIQPAALHFFLETPLQSDICGPQAPVDRYFIHNHRSAYIRGETGEASRKRTSSSAAAQRPKHQKTYFCKFCRTIPPGYGNVRLARFRYPPPLPRSNPALPPNGHTCSFIKKTLNRISEMKTKLSI